VGENWNIVNDVTASNGHYVTVEPGVQSLDQAPGDDKSIEFSFSVVDNGTYSVIARINCPSYDDDSFWVKMDNGEYQVFNMLKNSGWEWIKFDDYALAEGEHSLFIAYREDGALLDKIFISNQGTTPEGMGDEAENLCNPTGVENSVQVLKDFALKQNYPNPFNPSTTIEYNLKRPGYVVLKIYAINGKEIDTLIDKYLRAGEHKIKWRAKGLASGIYFYRIQVGKFSQTRKFILLK
jgi:hypothetical protein